MNLFGMAELVAGDQFEPCVEIEHAEKRMREAVGREISRLCFVEKHESSFANSAESGEHGIFFGEERRVDGKRGFEATNAIFGQKEWKAESFEEWNWARRMAKDAKRVGNDAGFDLAEVGDDFAGGPARVGRARLPAVERNGVRGGEEAGLGMSELGADGIETVHFGIRNRQKIECKTQI